MTDERRPHELDADEAETLRAIGWQRSASGSSCPDSSLLVAAEDGALDEAVAARVRDHVAGCGTCQMLVKDLATVFAEEPGEDAAARIRSRISAGERPHSSPPYVWIGAGLAVAAGLIWFIVIPRQSPAPVPQPDVQVARMSPTAIPSVFVVGRPAIPPGDVDLAVRGEASTRVSLEDQIAAALDKADKGDLVRAALDLKDVVARNKDSRIAALALGAVELRTDQNADAVESLDRARSLKGDAATADEAGWFLGIALVRTGNTDRARSILDEICKRGGTRGPSACAGVAEIDRNKSSR